MKIIWATRGRAWGFRFLLDAGLPDPLPTYDLAFDGTDGDRTVCRRVGSHVALRFPDPLDRHDQSGRVIPHDIVVMPPLADEVRSVEDGLRLVWPLLAGAYDRVWDQATAPTAAAVRDVLDAGPSSPDVDDPLAEVPATIPAG